MRWIPTSLAMLLISAGFVALATAAEKSKADPDDPDWTIVGVSKGDFNGSSQLQAQFSPKTANWRVKLTSSKSNGKAASSIQLTFWVEVKVGPNKVWHAIPAANFRGAGGDSRVFTFDNGLESDGKPRKFKLEITGANVKNELTFEDQRPESKSDGKKGKKK